MSSQANIVSTTITDTFLPALFSVPIDVFPIGLQGSRQRTLLLFTESTLLPTSLTGYPVAHSLFTTLWTKTIRESSSVSPLVPSLLPCCVDLLLPHQTHYWPIASPKKATFTLPALT